MVTGKTGGLLVYLCINSLFILKYGLRVVPLSYVLAVLLLYCGFIAVLLRFSMLIALKTGRRLHLSVILCCLLLLVIMQQMIDPYELQVDRWSAIHNFISSLLAGHYPYAAQTHLGGYGSPFPVWQVFHIPFYLLGNVSLSFVVGVVVFLDAVRRVFGHRRAFVAFLLLLASPAFVYEVAVRSDLMTNFLLSAAIILYCHHYRLSFSSHYVLISIIVGLMASTRLSAVIPFGIYFLNDFLKSGYRRQTLSVAIVLTLFAATFLPFLLWNGEMLLFFEYNPFVLQSRQGHLTDFLLFVPLGLWLALSWRGNICRYALHTACFMVVLVAVTFMHNMYLNDSWNQLFESAYDITYFNMALPFLIIAIIPSDSESLC